jgi:hypothetical protein
MTNDRMTNDRMTKEGVLLVICDLDIGHFFVDKLSPARIVVIAKSCWAATASYL